MLRLTHIVVLALVAALGVQSYRLQGAQGERDILALEKSERTKRDIEREARNFGNVERTNEEHRAAAVRAGAVVVRGNAASGIRVKPAAPAGSRDESTVCFDRGQLDAAIAEYAGRLTGIAREGEALAAAYRACRAWALDVR